MKKLFINENGVTERMFDDCIAIIPYDSDDCDLTLEDNLDETEIAFCCDGEITASDLEGRIIDIIESAIKAGAVTFYIEDYYDGNWEFDYEIPIDKSVGWIAGDIVDCIWEQM